MASLFYLLFFQHNISLRYLFYVDIYLVNASFSLKTVFEYYSEASRVQEVGSHAEDWKSLSKNIAGINFDYTNVVCH